MAEARGMHLILPKKNENNERLTRRREPNTRPTDFHQTSTLVCVMTTSQTEEQGDFRLPACPVPRKTRWSGNRVQEHVDTLPPPAAAAAAAALPLPLLC